MKKSLRNITLQTLPNGYSLGVDKKKYMYFNEMELLAGFMVHVGLVNETPMEGTQMLRILFQTIIGQEYVEASINMRDTIDDLVKRCEEVEKSLHHLSENIKAASKNPVKPNAPVTRKKARKNKVVIDRENIDINDEAAAKLAEIEERLKNNPNIK